MTVVEIPELGPGAEVELGAEERRALRLVGDKLRVDWLDPDRVRISAAGYVGSVRLSPHLTVSVRTKVPVTNILALASLAYRRLPLPSPVGATEFEEAEPLDWLAFLIVVEVEALLARGLRQGYVKVQDELPYVRGRIQFAASARGWTNPALTPCEFTDFLLDTPENRVLRATLEALARSRLLPGLRVRAMTATEWLGNVTVRPLTPQLVAAVQLSRLNAHYRAALNLCRVYLDGRGVEQPTGEAPAPAFLFPMELVFESAVANYLQAQLRGVTIQPQRSVVPVSGGPSHVLTYRPDLVVGEIPSRLVLDTKYADPERRTRFGTRSFRNEDLYQIAFYANEYTSPGVLIYPRADRDVHVTFEVGGARCTIVSVDLSLLGLAGMQTLAAAARELLDDRDYFAT